MKKYILSLCCCLALLACDKDEPTAKTQDELISGFTIIDPNGNPLQDVGTPNEKSFNETGPFVRLYPNPASAIIELHFQAHTPTKVTAWLAFAQLDESLQQSPYYMVSAGTPGKIAHEFFKESEVRGTVNLQLDISSLAPGPYRLYLKSGEQLAWKNVLIKR